MGQEYGTWWSLLKTQNWKVSSVQRRTGMLYH